MLYVKEFEKQEVSKDDILNGIVEKMKKIINYKGVKIYIEVLKYNNLKLPFRMKFYEIRDSVIYENKVLCGALKEKYSISAESKGELFKAGRNDLNYISSLLALDD